MRKLFILMLVAGVTLTGCAKSNSVQNLSGEEYVTLTEQGVEEDGESAEKELPAEYEGDLPEPPAELGNVGYGDFHYGMEVEEFVGNDYTILSDDIASSISIVETSKNEGDMFIRLYGEDAGAVMDNKLYGYSVTFNSVSDGDLPGVSIQGVTRGTDYQDVAAVFGVPTDDEESENTEWRGVRYLYNDNTQITFNFQAVGSNWEVTGWSVWSILPK